MNLHDTEIKLSNISIDRNNSLIKFYSTSIKISGCLILFLVIQAYFLKGFIWINGFVEGFFIMSIIHDVFSIYIAKEEIEVDKARLHLYTTVKEQLENLR